MYLIGLSLSFIIMVAGVALVMRGNANGWSAVLLGAIPVAVGVVHWLGELVQLGKHYRYTVELTPREVICRRSDGQQESVKWHELKSVWVYGVRLEGFTLLLNDPNSGCAIPSGAKGVGKVVELLKTLPGFDFEAVRAAAMSDGKTYRCWERSFSHTVGVFRK